MAFVFIKKGAVRVPKGEVRPQVVHVDLALQYESFLGTHLPSEGNRGKCTQARQSR